MGAAALSREVAGLEETRRIAMLGADTTALRMMSSAALVYIHSRGEADDRDSYLEKVKSGHFTYHRLDFTIEGVDALPGVAVVHGLMKGTVDVAGTRRDLDCRYLAVWAQEEHAWRFRAYQATPIARDG